MARSLCMTWKALMEASFNKYIPPQFSKMGPQILSTSSRLPRLTRWYKLSIYSIDCGFCWLCSTDMAYWSMAGRLQSNCNPPLWLQNQPGCPSQSTKQVTQKKKNHTSVDFFLITLYFIFWMALKFLRKLYVPLHNDWSTPWSTVLLP